MLEYPPCQLLTASLDHVFVKIEQPLDTTPWELQRIPISHQTYIPALKRYLSHAWIDETLITSTASKADNAALPCRLWDARLELVFPGCLPHLNFMRRKCLQFMRRRLFREIRFYLRESFGTNWSTTLALHRSRIALGSVTEHWGGG